jgi:hypothetical protein
VVRLFKLREHFSDSCRSLCDHFMDCDSTDPVMSSYRAIPRPKNTDPEARKLALPEGIRNSLLNLTPIPNIHFHLVPCKGIHQFRHSIRPNANVNTNWWARRP